MIDNLIIKGTDFLITFLSKEEHMLFIGGFILGAILGGLVDRFIIPMVWKPKQS